MSREAAWSRKVEEEVEAEEDEKHSEPACPWEAACTAAAFITPNPSLRLRLLLRHVGCVLLILTQEPGVVSSELTDGRESGPCTSTLPGSNKASSLLLLLTEPGLRSF